MTEKRFESDGWKITDNKTNEDIGMIKASKLLNQLYEEKEELWKENCQLDNYIKFLEKSLKSDSRYKICRKQQVRQANSIHQLLKEKELLKSQVNEMIELFIDSGLDYHISDELDAILYEDEDWDND